MAGMSTSFSRRGSLARASLAVVATLAFVAGCSPKRAVQVFPPAGSRDAIQRARDILSLYAAGQPVGSESMGFDVMVADVRAIDPESAAVLERGLAEIMARREAARTIAIRLLEALPTSAAAAPPPAKATAS